MATSLVSILDSSLLSRWIITVFRKAIGLVLIGLGLFFALSFWGFEASDPSFNHAASGKVINLMGYAGAVVSDFLYQSFGMTVWIIPVAILSIGFRLLTTFGISRPWIPAVSLPLALLLLSAYLASWPLNPASDWPFRAGYGGVVGDLEFFHLQQHISPNLYVWITGLSGFAFAVLSLGLGWRESVKTARQLGHHSARVGRHMGDVAIAATNLSSQMLEDGMRRFERRRPLDAPVLSNHDDIASEPINGDQRGVIQRMKSALAWFERDKAPDFIEIRPETLNDQATFMDDEDAQADAPATAKRPSKMRRSSAVRPKSTAVSPLPRESERATPQTFTLPTLDFLVKAKQSFKSTITKASLNETSRQLETVLDDFGVRGEIIDAKPGPVVTLLELEPAPGTRSQRVISLADDIARSLCAMSVRVATVPGRNVIGIELPNPEREIVFLRELLQSAPYNDSEARLPLALGKDISGNTIIVDLARMPHLLIAGTTGSGKSVAINAMILSLLFRLNPDQCRIIMIDPKVIELSVYEDIPHLLAPVVTEPHKAVVALKWVVRQMDERYRLMSHLGVRDIFAYNRRLEQARAKGQSLTRRVRVGFEPGTGQPIMEEQPIDMTPLPLIVVVVDEVADLMLTAGKEIESAIQRLSQKARAAGIHLIVATQRPSVDVLTGVIKANLPSRISFRVSSKIDSRTILGEPGAEQLLGQGDMLYLMPGDRIMRGSRSAGIR